MGDYGGKISKPGYDVKTATLDQLVFTSLYNNLKIKEAQTGTWTITSGNKFNSKSITLTGLTAIPFYAIFVEVNNKNYYINNGGFIIDVDGAGHDLFLFTYITDASPPVLVVGADSNANPTFSADRDLDYYLYLGIDDI